MTQNITLYIGSTCRFCHKVLEHLKKKGITVEIKDVWSDDAAKDELQALMGKTQVPCLSINGVGMLESDDIIKKIDELYP